VTTVPPQQLRFALVGCGRIAQRHAEHITRLGTLAAVCDVVPERAERLATATGARAYDSLDALLAGEPSLDVVSICSPNGLHARQTIKALDHGVHVLCEKPMAITARDCGEMIKAAERNNRRLFVVKQNRFNPPVVALKQIIDEGRLGRLFSVQLNCFWNRGPDYYRESWKGTRDLDGGTLFTQFSHFIDLLYWLVGDIADVQGFRANYAHQGVIEFEDTGAACLRFANGVIGTLAYTVNAHARNMEGSLSVFGERGTVKVGGQYLNELEYQNIEDYRITDLPAGNQANNYGAYQGSMSNHDKVYANLIDVLTGGGAISTSGFEGLKTVEIVQKIMGGLAWVDPDAPDFAASSRDTEPAGLRVVRA
jgi:UDP-N-acetyl-2-amino-2-deoxyglucuronate dehydrogenase